MKWCAQTFLQIFGLFAIFVCNLAKIVVPPSDENVNSSLSESAILLKKTVKTTSKSTHKP